MKVFNFDLQRFQNLYEIISGTRIGDTLTNSKTWRKIYGRDGKDTVYNSGSTVQVYDENDDDVIFNYGSYVTIYGGEGNDRIYNERGAMVKIYGGDGNDYILYEYSRVATIDGGDGDDTIISRGDYVTISGGKGDDRIDLRGVGNLIKYTAGDGNDVIIGFRSDDTISITGGTYTTSILDWCTVLNIGDGSITLSGIKKLDNINIIGTQDKNLVYTENDDAINNTLDGATISALKGNDSIINVVDNVWISGDAGDDVISLGSTSSYNVIQYVDGDGNDTVYGYNVSDTINISEGSYTTMISGNDAIIYVGSGSMTVKDVNGKKLNIVGTEDKPTWTISGTTATYGTTNKTLTTITGLKSGTKVNDIYLSGSTVTLSANALGMSKVSITGNYTLALANGVETPSTTAAGWNISGTTATYKTANTSAGYTLSADKKSVTYSTGSGGETLITLTGVKSLNGISLNGNIVTIAKSALGTTDVKMTSNGYTLTLSSDVAKSEIKEAVWSLSGTTAIYKAPSVSAGYILDGNKISYQPASGGETLITLTGVKSLNGISLNGNIITVAKSALGTNNISLTGTGYTLALTNGVETPQTTANTWNISGTTAIYKAGNTSAGYTLSSDSKTIIYQSASSGNTLTTISGLKSGTSVNDISLSGSTVTLSANALGTSKVSITGDYMLALANNVETPKTTEASWNISGTIATYADKISAGYVLSNDKKTIAYQQESTGTTFVTITGLKSGTTINDISLNGTTVTVSANALNTSSTVRISNGYTLALASNVVKSQINYNNTWSINGTTATYKSGGTSAGYVLSDDGKSISYQAVTSGETLATITGLRSGTTINDISLNGTTVTVSANALSTSSTVKISSGYTLALASNVPKTSTNAASWTINGTTATYAGSVSAGYVLSDDSKTISYQAATSGETLVTITGLKSGTTINDISLNGTTVTVSANALNTSSTVRISNGYTLALASNVAKPQINYNNTWSISNTTATYKSGGASAGYVLSDDSKTISYQPATSGETLAMITNLKNNADTSGITVNGNIITLPANVLNQKTVTLTYGDYKLALASNVAKPQNDDNNTWSISNTTATYKSGGTTAGYVPSDDGTIISYQAATSGETLARITNLKSNADTSGITVNGSVITLSASVLNQKTVTLTYGDYTLALASNVTKPQNNDDASWSISNTTATYKSGGASAGYVLSDDSKTISYQSAMSGETFAIIMGLKNNADTSGITVNGNVITLPASVLNQKTITLIYGDYTLALASNVTKPQNNGDTSWNISGTTAIYKSEGTSAGYVLSDDSKTISYQAATSGETLVTITGLKNGATIDDISLNGTTVKVSANALSPSSLVKISNGYTLALASNVVKPQNDDNNTWSISGTTAIYKSGGITAGYVLSNDGSSISYQPATNGETLATITGLKSNADTSGIKVNGSVITLPASVLNQKTVTVAYGSYTLAISDSAPGYSFTDDKKSIIYSSPDPKITDLNGIKYDNKNGIVTADKNFNESDLDLNEYEEDIKIFNGAKIKSDLSIIANDNGNSIVTGAGDDEINGGDDDDTLNGGKGNDFLTGNGGNDTFVFSAGNDTVSDYEEGDKIFISNGKVKNYVYENNDLVFTIGKGSLTISNAKGMEIELVNKQGNMLSSQIYYDFPANTVFDSKKSLLTADKKFDEINIDLSEYDRVVKNFNGSKVKSNFSITADDVDTSILGGTGDDEIYGGTGNDTLNGGKGDDTLSGGNGADTFVYASGGGNDVIEDYAADEGDVIQFTGKITKTEYIGDNVIFTIGKNKLTVEGGNGQKITFVDKKGKVNTKLTQVYSGSNADLIDDYNFVSIADLSDILDTSTADAVGKIDSSVITNLESEKTDTNLAFAQ